MSKTSAPIWKVADNVMIQLALYIGISFFLSLILILIEPFLFFILPFVTGLIALVFIIRMAIKAVKWRKLEKLQFCNAYLIGIAVILLIETGVVLWIIYEINNMRWI